MVTVGTLVWAVRRGLLTAPRPSEQKQSSSRSKFCKKYRKLCIKLLFGFPAALTVSDVTTPNDTAKRPPRSKTSVIFYEQLAVPLAREQTLKQVSTSSTKPATLAIGACTAFPTTWRAKHPATVTPSDNTQHYSTLFSVHKHVLLLYRWKT